MQTSIHVFFCKMKSQAHTHQYNSIYSLFIGRYTLIISQL